MLPPYLASLVFGWSLFTNESHSYGFAADVSVSNALDFGALAIIFAGVFLVARYRGALEVSDSAGQAWKLERDASVAHSERLVIEVAAEKAKVVILEAQPNLTGMENVLKQLLSVTELHERNAELRRDSIVEVIRATR